MQLPLSAIGIFPLPAKFFRAWSEFLDSIDSSKFQSSSVNLGMYIERFLKTAKRSLKCRLLMLPGTPNRFALRNTADSRNRASSNASSYHTRWLPEVCEPSKKERGIVTHALRMSHGSAYQLANALGGDLLCRHWFDEAILHLGVSHLRHISSEPSCIVRQPLATPRSTTHRRRINSIAANLLP
jgi:hypothetical protein